MSENIKLVVKAIKQPQQTSARLARGKYLAQIVAQLASLLALAGNVEPLEGFINSALAEVVEIKSPGMPEDKIPQNVVVLDGASDKEIEPSKGQSTTIVAQESEVTDK